MEKKEIHELLGHSMYITMTNILKGESTVIYKLYSQLQWDKGGCCGMFALKSHCVAALGAPHQSQSYAMDPHWRCRKAVGVKACFKL